MAALGFRLSHLLTSTCSIYRRSDAIDGVTKKRGEPSWTLVASGVPYFLATTQNDDDPTGAGRMKRRTALTEDDSVFHISADVRSGDLIKDTTADANGGTVSRVMGDPRKVPGTAWRPVESQFVKLFEEPDPPVLP